MKRLLMSLGLVAGLLSVGCGSEASLESDSELKRRVSHDRELVGRYVAGGYVGNEVVSEGRVQQAYAGIFDESDFSLNLDYLRIQRLALQDNVSLRPNNWNTVTLRNGQQLIIGSSRGVNPGRNEPDTQSNVVIRRVNGELQMNKRYYFRDTLNNETGFFPISSLNKIRFISYLPAEVEVEESRRNRVRFRINLVGRF